MWSCEWHPHQLEMPPSSTVIGGVLNAARGMELMLAISYSRMGPIHPPVLDQSMERSIAPLLTIVPGARHIGGLPADTLDSARMGSGTSDRQLLIIAGEADELIRRDQYVRLGQVVPIL
jgi:hypothetical protein